MKKLSLLIVTLFCVNFLFSQDYLKGIWLTGEENTKIETYQKDGAWYGKIIASDNPKAKMGTDILKGLKPDDGVLKGKLYAIKRGKELNAEIRPSKDVLLISVSAGLFSKDLQWKREGT